MSSTNLMNSNKGRAGCHYTASPLTRPYSSMPNIMLLTPAETDETKILSATTAKSRPEPNVAVPVTCVDLQRYQGCCDKGGDHEHGAGQT
ncbi:unnamed protein product [Macrosiphum euphorbiae]|uniref:Uncharacterized protein n=1 Tax=Macrosiphum euphorbiae TaxID=13131 RepID=A0AAV0VPR7_9HEMI|nr:unnamed protein product [Macrosiphum euphorbiae]